MNTARLVAAYDLHFPAVSWPTFFGMMDFVSRSDLDGFLFGGDQFDNSSISHHTKRKPALRSKAAHSKDTKGFDERILAPLESYFKPDKHEMIWIEGNHDDWENQLVEEQPELAGSIERPILLGLQERGWKVIPTGKSWRKGKLTYIHGELLSGYGNQASQYHAKKAVDTFATNVLYGHMHTPQSFTRVMPHDKTQKWMAYCSPILGKLNPHYLRNRPTAWVNGFNIIEYHGKSGHFNVYPVITTEGEFAYGGQTYSHKNYKVA